jgi:hypothetical protein
MSCHDIIPTRRQGAKTRRHVWRGTPPRQLLTTPDSHEQACSDEIDDGESWTWACRGNPIPLIPHPCPRVPGEEVQRSIEMSKEQHGFLRMAGKNTRDLNSGKGEICGPPRSKQWIGLSTRREHDAVMELASMQEEQSSLPRVSKFHQHQHNQHADFHGCAGPSRAQLRRGCTSVSSVGP